MVQAAHQSRGMRDGASEFPQTEFSRLKGTCQKGKHKDQWRPRMNRASSCVDFLGSLSWGHWFKSQHLGKDHWVPGTGSEVWRTWGWLSQSLLSGASWSESRPPHTTAGMESRGLNYTHNLCLTYVMNHLLVQRGEGGGLGCSNYSATGPGNSLWRWRESASMWLSPSDYLHHPQVTELLRFCFLKANCQETFMSGRNHTSGGPAVSLPSCLQQNPKATVSHCHKFNSFKRTYAALWIG